MRDVSLATLTEVADTPPTVTPDTAETLPPPKNPVPTMVMVVEPPVGPDDGVTDEIVGIGAKVKFTSEFEAEPLVTTTAALPAVFAGVVAEIEVSFTTVKAEAAVPPKDTAVAPVNPLPVIVTLVPPAKGPAVGKTEETTGAPLANAGCKNWGETEIRPTIRSQIVAMLSLFTSPLSSS